MAHFDRQQIRYVSGIVALILGLLGVAYWVRHSVELPSDRVAIAERVNKLRESAIATGEQSREIDELIDIASRGTSFARVHAIVALGSLGTMARRASDSLIQALTCGDPYIEREAARALGPITKGTNVAVNALIVQLKEESRDVVWFAADSLGEIGEPARIAIPRLQTAAKSDDFNMARSAKAAIEKLSK